MNKFKRKMLCNFNNYRFWIALPILIIGLILMIISVVLNKLPKYFLSIVIFIFSFLDFIVEVLAKIICLKIILKWVRENE